MKIINWLKSKMNSSKAIDNALMHYHDTLVDLDFTDMNFQLELQDNCLRLLAGFPVKPFEETLKPSVEKILRDAFPNQPFTLEFRQFIQAHKTQLAGKGLRGVKNVIAVASGKGGVGKSTVTVNLAAALSQAGARVGILDADIYGPSIPMMLGKHEPVQIQNDKYVPVNAHNIQAMSIGYLTKDENQALIWRGPMLAKSLIQMLDITLWDELDYLFIDLPPGTGDIQLSLVQKIPLTGAVVVTTPQNVATLDAQKAIQMFERTNINVLGIIENMSTHICSSCGHEEPIFGAGGAQAISETFDVPLLGQLPLNAHIRQQCDEGMPSALGDDTIATLYLKAALRLTISLSKQPLNYGGTEVTKLGE